MSSPADDLKGPFQFQHSVSRTGGEFSLLGAPASALGAMEGLGKTGDGSLSRSLPLPEPEKEPEYPALFPRSQESQAQVGVPGTKDGSCFHPKNWRERPPSDDPLPWGQLRPRPLVFSSCFVPRRSEGRAGQPGFGLGRAGPGGLSEEGVGTPGGEPWPGAGQRLVGLQEPRRWISWGGVYTASGWTGDIFLR